MPIPARLHFCWIGPRLPWAYVFAVLSAAERSGLPDIVLHHTDALVESDELQALRRAPCVRLFRIDPRLCLTQTGHRLGLGDGLAELYRSLADPVMRSDVLRAAILYLEGGIYLDLDTVTVGSLRPLLDATQFVGSEVIVWPHSVRVSRSPTVLARHLALDLVRKALRRAPQGWAAFRRIERFYARGVNNAVMGAEPQAGLLADYLQAMLALSPERQSRRYALGPSLLQQVVARHQGHELTIHQPQAFYPLPPEISEHWFRTVRRVRLDAVLSAETRVVHWYASVRTRALVAQITPRYVEDHHEHQLYSALVRSCLRTLPQTT